MERRKIFKEIAPSKEKYSTVSGKTAFSKEYVEYNLKNPYDACVVGTAFDYVARWMTTRIVKEGKETVIS